MFDLCADITASLFSFISQLHILTSSPPPPPPSHSFTAPDRLVVLHRLTDSTRFSCASVFLPNWNSGPRPSGRNRTNQTGIQVCFPRSIVPPHVGRDSFFHADFISLPPFLLFGSRFSWLRCKALCLPLCLLSLSLESPCTFFSVETAAAPAAAVITNGLLVFSYLVPQRPLWQLRLCEKGKRIKKKKETEKFSPAVGECLCWILGI